MRRWAFLLGGLTVWFVHFLGVYALASIADLRGPSEQAVWRGVHLAFSLACAAMSAALTLAAARRVMSSTASERFLARLAALGGGVGLLAILWQSLPPLL
jgi:hypothetical protein